ncbi:MAG: hypothetical protein ACR2PJ_02780 [Pseudomonadales bacterium]
MKRLGRMIRALGKAGRPARQTNPGIPTKADLERPYNLALDKSAKPRLREAKKGSD